MKSSLMSSSSLAKVCPILCTDLGLHPGSVSCIDSGSTLVKLSSIFTIPLTWKTCKKSCILTYRRSLRGIFWCVQDYFSLLKHGEMQIWFFFAIFAHSGHTVLERLIHGLLYSCSPWLINNLSSCYLFQATSPRQSDTSYNWNNLNTLIFFFSRISWIRTSVWRPSCYDHSCGQTNMWTPSLSWR